MSKQKIVTIVGTTAVGKSDLAIAIAKKINGEIINADSLQVYKGVPILTNKVVVDEPKHHLMNMLDWDKTYSVRKFVDDADKIIQDIHNRGKVPIVVGGTNYYIQMLLFGNDFHDLDYIDNSKDYNDLETSVLIERVRKYDDSYATKNTNNRRKLVYALNIYEAGHTLNNDFSLKWKRPSRYNSIIVWCSSDLQTVDARINKRVDQMIENGLLQELKDLETYWKSRAPVFYNDIKGNEVEGVFQSIGFKEFLPYIVTKKEESLTECLELMKCRTRQYSRGQIKWIRARIVPRVFNPYKESECHLCIVDSTFADLWDSSVIPMALKCINSYFEGFKIDPMEVLQYQMDLIHTKFPKFCTKSLFNMHSSNISPNKYVFSDPNERFECVNCNQVIFGLREWDLHISSKKHRKYKSQ
eukprot:NODE_39_length_35218_cov_0.479655.p5 type:complete len:413 gc:universal NODE_39_length_35218_cov_0.479655:28629-27391(-)